MVQFNRTCNNYILTYTETNSLNNNDLFLFNKEDDN